MQFNELRTPAPGLGQSQFMNQGVAAPVPPAPRKDAPGQIQPASNHGTVEYQQTNPTEQSTVLVRPYGDGMERYLQRGDIVFVRADDTASRGPLGTGRLPPMQVANLQMLNTIMQRDPEGPAAAINQKHKWVFLGILEHISQLSGGTGARGGAPRHADKLLSMQVRGKSCRVVNHWPNSKPLDKVGFMYYSVQTAAEARNKYSAQDYKPLYTKYDYGTGALPPSKRSRTEAEDERKTPDESKPVQSYGMMVPVNFTRNPKYVDSPKAFYVGVISDMFHRPAASPSEVTPSLTMLDERLTDKRHQPQCELFIRVA